MLATYFFQDLRRRIRRTVVAMPGCHILKCRVAIRFAGVPMHSLPAIAEDLSKRIVGGQRHPNTKPALKASG